jgi:hypothetical protein
VDYLPVIEGGPLCLVPAPAHQPNTALILPQQLSEIPSPRSLQAGTSVVSKHPSYGERWWRATVTASDAEGEDDDEGVFLQFDDGDQAYQKLDQLRVIQPLLLPGSKLEDEPGAPLLEAHEGGREVLVSTRQYLHNDQGPFHEYRMATVAQVFLHSALHAPPNCAG